MVVPHNNPFIPQGQEQTTALSKRKVVALTNKGSSAIMPSYFNEGGRGAQAEKPAEFSTADPEDAVA